jgi:pimeloyl-ACP methyl ester carboxylesterase
MAGQYAIKYQNNVTKLLLLSPLGFTKREMTNSTVEERKEKYEKMTFFQKQLYKIRMSFWRDKMTFSQIANKYAWAVGFLMKKWLTKRFRLNSDIGELLWDYLLEIWRLPVSSEKALYYIINQDIIAFQALEEAVIDLQIPVCVYYGDKDWMDDSGARRVHLNNRKTDFELFYVDDCGHQVTMENPEEFLKHFWRRHNSENCEAEILVS